MREILFRGQTRRYGEKVRMNGDKVPSNWVFGGVCQGVADYSIIYGNDDVELKKPTEKWVVYTDTIGQFTGLYDDTKWKDLTDAEKLDFYHQHYIGEDGMSVRFQHVDDVKRLWEGKKIFEGDIVYYTTPDDSRAYGLVKFGEHGNGGTCNVGFCIDWFGRYDTGWLRNDIGFWAKYREIKVIGNIHDNPELLEGA